MSSAAATIPRGAFVLFEGCDRCGKTTQSNMIVDFLNSKYGAGSAVWLKFPGQHSVSLFLQTPGFFFWNLTDRTTEIGKMINSYLTNTLDMDDKCLHLLFSANRWEAVSAFSSLLVVNSVWVFDNSFSFFSHRKKIRSLLEQGTTIVVDRYAYSGVAFSATKASHPPSILLSISGFGSLD